MASSLLERFPVIPFHGWGIDADGRNLDADGMFRSARGHGQRCDRTYHVLQVGRDLCRLGIIGRIGRCVTSRQHSHSDEGGGRQRGQLGSLGLAGFLVDLAQCCQRTEQHEDQRGQHGHLDHQQALIPQPIPANGAWLLPGVLLLFCEWFVQRMSPVVRRGPCILEATIVRWQGG